MDQVSDNFVAEMLVKELGAVQGQGGTTAAGVGFVTGLLAQAGVPLDGVRLVDGSGLSLLDRLTPDALASLLSTMWGDVEVRLELLSSLPVAGRTGTLHDRMRRSAAAGVVRAKTGTTSNASALSGFAGDRYVFSILQNGWPISWSLGPRRAGSLRDGASRLPVAGADRPPSAARRPPSPPSSALTFPDPRRRRDLSSSTTRSWTPSLRALRAAPLLPRA